MLPGIQLGPFRLHYYGIILMLGAVAAAFLARHEARRRNLDGELVWDAMIYALLGGIIGARLWHLALPSASEVALTGRDVWYNLTHPLVFFEFWNGGLGIPGAVIGGVLGMYIFCRRRKLNFLQWLDIGAPGLALAQAVGRWGNFVNQELYGSPSSLPWAITIDPDHRLPAYKDQATYHPLFLYESLWSLMNMAVLLWVGRRYPDRLKNGDIFLLYLVIYPTGRFLLEFLRLDTAQVGGFNANQTFMAVIAVASALVLFWRHRPGGSNPESLET